jgi:thiol-disulfide isomerase/thioredoxin
MSFIDKVTVMHYFSRHPAHAELSDFLAGSDPGARSRIASHLEHCQSCRDVLQLLRGASASQWNAPGTEPSPELLARILESRASDARVILPSDTQIAGSRSTPNRLSLIAAAAVILAVIGGVLVTRTASDVEAGATSGTLVLNPAMPRPGQTVSVTYRAAAMLANQPTLVLRARMRDTGSESYNAGFPTVRAAMLQRGADGDFTGHFVIPANIVYAALAVADTSAQSVDDNAGRDWEILVSDSTGKPLFTALDQRANDMMGRNWEEGLATAHRMVALYPRDLRAWSWLRAFNRWLGKVGDDSIRVRDRAQLAKFDSMFTNGVASDADIGRMAWFADGIDSSIAAHWRARLMQQAPRNSFAVQWRLIAILDTLHQRNDTATVLRQMDALWDSAPLDPKAQIATYATGMAMDAADTTLIKLWTTRQALGGGDKRDFARWVATQFTKIPALRAEGIKLVRNEMDSLAILHPSEQALDETIAEQRARHNVSRRNLLATLGQALVASGDYAGARQVLDEAVSKGWNLEVFRAVRTASLAAGDTAHALTMAARISVDPRTSPTFTDSLRPVAERVLGAAGWNAELATARKEFVKRMLESSTPRSIRGDPRLRDLDGQTTKLSALAQGKVTIVAFWSRFCGPAIEDLPVMNAVATRLAKSGVRVVSVVDEANSSAALKQFLRDRKVTMPTYLDSWHEGSRAFNQWGTPDYYVIDADGRIRFAGTNSAETVLARAEALRMSEN